MLSPARFTSALAVTLFCALFATSSMARQDSASPVAESDVSSSTALYAGLSYRMVGPSQGGRVTAVAGHSARPGTYYFGATGGGVWKTEDYGTSWRPVSDDTFMTGSIGAIDVSDSNPDILYVGTGSDGIRSNVIVGRGVYKSEDAGATWRHVGLRETGQIGAVVIHPTNPEVVWVAALGNPFTSSPERGIYKTTDGGDTWDHVLFVSENTGAVDLELNPQNPDEAYAALWFAERKPWTIISGSDRENGIYITGDGGQTWHRQTSGLPSGLTGKIDLAVSPADPSRIYALIEAVPEEEGLYRSNDRGETWHLVTTQRGLMNRPFYYTNVDADPSNADVVYVNNERFYRSEDGGKTFETRSTPHGDNHDMWISSVDPNLFIQSNDGGANVTRDGGATWSTQDNQPTAELYQVDVDDAFPYRLYAGQQDNGTTISVPSLPTTGVAGNSMAYWDSPGGCETGPAVPKPGNPDIVYTNCKGRFGRFSRTTGQEQFYYVGAVHLYGRNPADLPFRFQRVAPIEVSPHNPDVIYHGSQYVHRTMDEGKTWETLSPDLTAFRPERQVPSGAPITRDITGEEHYSVLYVIEESPVEKGVIWTGSNDGPIHVSRDDGATWTNVTPPDMPPEGRIQNIDPSPHNGAKAYVAGYRYLLGDFEPYIYRTSDYGRSWERLTDGQNGIPIDTPTRVVREDPDREGLLYAGTEFGMYISFNDGIHWQSFQLNLPITPITDLKIVRKDLIVSTMGRSFWIMDDISPLHEMSPRIVTNQAYLFQPRDAYRMRYESSSGENGGPQYSAPGARIDYYLGPGANEPVSVRIFDDAGAVVRSFSSPDKNATVVSSSRSGSTRGSDQHDAILGKDAGVHRFTWDLRHSGPLGNDLVHEKGPLVVPGTYTVEFSAGDVTDSKSFEVLIDPRVAADGVTQAHLQEQLSISQRIGDVVSEGWMAVAEIDSLVKRIETANDRLASEAASFDSKTKNAGDGSLELEKLRAQLNALHSSMVTDNSDSYPPQMLMDQLGYLLGMTTNADQKPGNYAEVRLAQLRSALDDVQRGLTAIRSRAEVLLPEKSD